MVLSTIILREPHRKCDHKLALRDRKGKHSVLNDPFFEVKHKAVYLRGLPLSRVSLFSQFVAKCHFKCLHFLA